MTTERNKAPWPGDAQKLLLGDLEIDLRYRVIRREGVPSELNARAFELLLLFLREPRVLHTRDAIFAKLWPGLIVEDASLSTCIWMLRRAFGSSAKHWIRTVPKKGYVFDPPDSVQLRAGPLAEPAVVPPPDAPPEPAGPEPAGPGVAVARPSSLIRWKHRALAAAGVALTLLVGGAALSGNGTLAPVTQVALVVTSDAATVNEARWPASLLQAWLAWQLGGFSDLSLVDAADLCSGCRETVVLLGVTVPVQQDGEWVVSARFRGAQDRADIVRRCAGEKLIETIDQVAGEVVSTFEPGTDLKAFPALKLETDAARKLVEGMEEERQHHWGKAAQAYAAAAEKTPAFGYSQVRLAQSLAAIEERQGAIAALNQAESWLATLPPQLHQPILARQALIRRDYAGAAAAYAGLVSKDDDRHMAYRIAEAQALRLSDNTREAAELLGNEPPAADSDLAIDWLIERGSADIANHNFADAVRLANEAMDRAHRLGWDHEHARAVLLYADVQFRQAEHVPPDLYRQAALEFENTGDHLGALRAGLQAELDAAGPHPALSHLGEVLAEARLTGNPDVEFDALHLAGFVYENNDDFDRARQLYSQAVAVAEAAGNESAATDLQFTLLSEDSFNLDFASMDKRLAALRTKPLENMQEYKLELAVADLAYMRGDYKQALDALGRGDAALRQANAGDMSRFSSEVSCSRIDNHIAQGLVDAARDDIRDCRATKEAAPEQFSDISEAELAFDTGDLTQARHLVDRVWTELSQQPSEENRWAFTVQIASLMARVGEADAARKALEQIMPQVKGPGYRYIEAGAHTALAEIALAQGRADEAASEAALGQALAPADDWEQMQRLRTVQALVARAHGRDEEATDMFQSLHAEAKKRGDVLAELLIHSLGVVKDCPEEQHASLVAQSGMRGASDQWMQLARPSS
jgi:cellulose synthase operon protein C